MGETQLSQKAIDILISFFLYFLCFRYTNIKVDKVGEIEMEEAREEEPMTTPMMEVSLIVEVFFNSIVGLSMP